jgi:cysteine desulfurase family protein (TIGR01976 family)
MASSTTSNTSTSNKPIDIDSIRAQFPSLSRSHNGLPLIYLDGPAGTQVPLCVADRIHHAFINHSANRAGKFITSIEVDHVMDEAHQAAADLLHTTEPKSIAFGPNMTTLTLAFSRAIAKTWNPGDEILVSHLDHDANFTPWILAAQDAGATVKTIDIHPEDATLNLDSLQSLLSHKTKLVALTAASNAVGSLTDIPTIAKWVHDAGAELFVDAVHYAPHRRIDVQAWDCDFLVCSAYKFFGPHIGILYGKPNRMQELSPYKLRPSPNSIPGRWMTGTQNHPCIAGLTAAIDYIASLDPSNAPSRSQRLNHAFQWIQQVESERISQLLEGLGKLPHVKLYGIKNPQDTSRRAPTLAFQIHGLDSHAAAEKLAEQAICAWHGNYYALPLSTALKTEPQGMVRLGCMHYNTEEEIDRTLHAIAKLQ